MPRKKAAKAEKPPTLIEEITADLDKVIEKLVTGKDRSGTIGAAIGMLQAMKGRVENGYEASDE